MSLDRAVEVTGVEPDEPVQFVGPLHRTRAHVPQPRALVGERLGLPHPHVGFGEGRLRDLLLGDVAGHDDDGRRRSVRMDDGDNGERDRHRHAEATLQVDFEVMHRVAGPRGLQRGKRIGCTFALEHRSCRLPEHLRRPVAEDPLGAAVPVSDHARGVDAEHCFVRRVQHRVQHRIGALPRHQLRSPVGVRPNARA